MATFQDYRKRDTTAEFPPLRPLCDSCSVFIDGFSQQHPGDTVKRVWAPWLVGAPCIECGTHI